MHREPEVLEAEAQVGKWVDFRARITSKEFAPLYSVKNDIFQNACSARPKRNAGLGKIGLMRIDRLMNSVAKRSKTNGDKSAVAMLKITRQLGCVFQDMEPPKSASILRKSSNILKPIRCVRFIEAVVRHANIRDQNPSLGMICPGDLHQRNPNAPKFEDRSQEETEWQERCAREAAWRLAKKILKLKEKHETTFFSFSENWCLFALSTLQPEERLFVVDSERRCTWLAKKDLNSAEWIGNRDDIEKSDDGFHSQWWSADAWRGHSLWQRFGYILDYASPRGYASSCIAWKALRWTRIFIRVVQRSKTTSHYKRYSDTARHGELRSDRGSWFIIEFFLKLVFFNIHDTFKEGNWSSHVSLKVV